MWEAENAYLKQYADEKALCETVRSHYNALINTLCTLVYAVVC